jgi:hypothetical protein
MTRLMLAVLLTAFSIGSAAAQAPGTCESKAIEKTAATSPQLREPLFLRNASVRPAHPRRSDRMASRLRAQRRTASWRSAQENKVNAPAFLPIGGIDFRATQARRSPAA